MSAIGARPSSARPGDDARARLARARTGLLAAALSRAALWGAAGGATVLAARAVLGASGVAWPIVATAVALVVAGVSLRRSAPRGVSAEQAALWIEARVPALRYALVTLADDAAPVPDGAARSLDAAVREARWDDAMRRALTRAVVPPAAVLLAATALALFAPPSLAHVREAAREVRRGSAAPTPARDRLARLRATVTPPAYSRLPSQRLTDPSSVEALVGSALVITGAGEPAGLTATLAADSGAPTVVAVTATGGDWRVALSMPDHPMALRLADGRRTRLVVLAPRPDATPRLTLDLPGRDTVLRTPTGSMLLAASADDDLGLASGQFEWIVSSGEGESFTFRSGSTGFTTLGGTHATMRGMLSITGLGLKPGDLVHLRVTARDHNPQKGRAPGASETRTIRIARAGEYDSVAVDAAPPALGDTSQLGQRMLLILTEALVKKQPSLQKPVFLAESRKIAVDQARLRKRVGDLVFSRLGESEGEEAQEEAEKRANMTPDELLAAASAATGTDLTQPLEGNEEESPIVAVNKPLLEAYNHMWDAGRALEIGEARKAIPPMRLAILALQKARAAERIYLRGKAPVAVVDIAKVRLAARVRADTMHLASRTARPPLDARVRTRLASLGHAAELATRDAAAAADTLSLLRVDALSDAPALAAALGEAVDALRAGRDATEAFVRARRLAAGVPARTGALGAWQW